MHSRVKIEIIAGLYEEFLNYLIENEFYISSVESTNLGVTLICMAKDYKQIAKAARRYQCKTKLLRKKGVYFWLRQIIVRKSIVFAVCSVFIYFFVFGKLIWKIDVISPNGQINQDIYNLLYNNNVYVGAVFSQDKNRDIIQQIFTDVEDVGYITLNFYKGVLTCKVDQKLEKAEYLQDLKTGNITATQDGVVKDLRIYNGFSDIKQGQTVTKGQILVSATYIDRNGDLHQVMPRAYIKAECVKKYTAQIELDKSILLRTGEFETEKILKLLGRDLLVERCDISDYKYYDYEKRYSYADMLGFRLPVTLVKNKYYKKEHILIKKDEETAVKAAEIIIDTLIKSDVSLETVYNKEYSYTISDTMLTMDCIVYGEYDITK